MGKSPCSLPPATPLATTEEPPYAPKGHATLTGMRSWAHEAAQSARTRVRDAVGYALWAIRSRLDRETRSVALSHRNAVAPLPPSPPCAKVAAVY